MLGDDGVAVPLSTGEFDLLLALVEHPQRTLSRDQLLDLARHRAANTFDRSMDTQVSRLRKKIERDPGRSEAHQDRMGRRLHLHPRREPGMTRFFPKSLFGQTLLILLVGLVISHAVGAWIYAGAREQAVRAIGGFAAAQRVANLSRLVEDAPADWRPRIVAALSDPTFRVALSAAAAAQLPADAEGAAKAIEDYVRQQLPERPDRQVRAAVLRAGGPAARRAVRTAVRSPAVSGADGRTGRHGRDDARHDGAGLRRRFGAWRGLQVAVKLSDGQWLSFATTLPQGAPSVSWQFIISMALMGVIVLAVSVWAVRRVTAPLGLLAGAADRLGRDVGGRTAGRGRHRRNAARRARLQPHAGTAAPADREPHPDAGRAVARSAHPADTAEAAHRGSRRRRRARQDAGDHQRDG